MGTNKKLLPLTSFRGRLFALTSTLVIITALLVSIFQQMQMEEHFLHSEMLHAKNLLKMAVVHIENQYESYLFHRESLLNERKQKLKNISELALCELNDQYQMCLAGKKSEEAAKKQCIEFFRKLRYADGNGYLWINNTESPSPKVVLHPIMPELEGEIMDSHVPLFDDTFGKVANPFQEFVDVCLAKGSGYVNYTWPKPTATGVLKSQPKLSFVSLFKPWNWIIGTGIYIDDIERDSKLRIEAIIRELQKAFGKIKVSKNSYLYVFNGKQKFIVHPDFPGKFRKDVYEPAGIRLMERLMEQAKTTESSEKSVEYEWKRPDNSRSIFNGNKRAFVAYFAPLDWYIVASVAMDEIYAPIWTLRWKIIGLMALIILFVLLFTSMLAKSLSRPLNRLSEAAMKIEAEGIYSVQIPISGAEETQNLGRCINSMLNSIKSSQNEKAELFNAIQREEEKHRITLNSIADAVISTDISGKILGMNPMAEKLTGWVQNEALGRDLDEVYNVLDIETLKRCTSPVERVINNQEQGLESEKEIKETIVLKSEDGSEYYVSENSSPIKNESGEIKGVVLVFRNITEDFLNQQLLKEAEWKFYALFENSLIAVSFQKVIFDSSGEAVDFFVIDSNKNFIEFIGVDPRGQNASEVFPDLFESNPDLVRNLGEVARTRKACRFQNHDPKTDRWYDGIIFCYKPDHCGIAFLEITEQRKLAQQLNQAQKMDAVGQLAGGIAHDFNNVLAGIIGAAELMSFSLKEDEKSRKYLGIIQESSERAADLIRKLLAFGRQNNIASTPVDVHVAIKEAIALLECSIDKKIEIEQKLDAHSSMVVGDIAQLQNVIINLGVNSSHAMPDGGLFKVTSKVVYIDEIECKAYSLEPGNYIKLEVSDTGVGINPENLQKVFEPFFTTKEQGKGTGLGLAASFGIIQQHKGAISVYSEPDVGAIFHILLPLTDVAGIPKARTQILAHGSGRILIIDDEQVIRVTATAILESLGYETVTAVNGQEGLEIYEQEFEKIDLVLLDMIMPVMNGRECYSRLKEINPDVKVILASGFSKEEDLHQMKKSGLSGFINKPYGVATLSQLIKKVMIS